MYLLLWDDELLSTAEKVDVVDLLDFLLPVGGKAHTSERRTRLSAF